MNVCIAMLNGWEIVLILAAILILFGAKKLPDLARGLGQGIREFKKATREVTDELQSSIDLDAPPPPSQRKIPPATPPANTVAETVEHSTAAQPPASTPRD